MTDPAIDPDARTARFVGRVTYHDDPAVLERLERAAAVRGTSVAAVIRSAVRDWLRRYDGRGRS